MGGNEVPRSWNEMSFVDIMCKIHVIFSSF
jgi:hypothetical protein